MQTSSNKPNESQRKKQGHQENTRKEKLIPYKKNNMRE